MGIKTKFNPMGGQNEKGKLSDWRYSTADNGQITLYEYLGQYSSTKPVYVPKKGGKTVINNYTSGTTTTASNTPFYENQNVISVDLQNVPFVGNNMVNAFSNCQNLTFVNNINPNTVRMLYTFKNCYNLNQNVQIPNSVQDMQRTFYNCHNLNQNIKLSSSVTVLAYTFFHCFNLNQNIQIPSSALHVPYLFRDCQNLNQNINIPDSVINTCGTFYNCFKLNQNISLSNATTTTQLTFYRCYNLNQNIRIPSSVTTTLGMFQYCYNLNQNIQIPNSVTSMVATFSHCYNLNQDIQIPRSVTNMNDVFDGCTNLQGNITILPSEVTDANYLFYGCSLSKNVIFPLRYINNVNTVTRNTLVTAATGGYAVGTAVGNLVNNTTQNAVFYAYDPIAWEGYNTWSGDGTHWTLSKWAGIGKAVGTTDVVVPQEITSYDTFPTMINRACFSKNTAITSIDLGADIPWVGNAVGTGTNGSNRNAVCLNCFNLKSAYGVIRNDVTDISAAFDRCYNLTDIRVVWPDSATKAYVTYEMINATDVPPFGEGLTNMQGCFYAANSLINYPVIPPKVTVFTTAFTNGASNSAYGNIFILSPGLTGNAAVAGAYFRGYNTSHRRNIYTYFNYSNGTTTSTRTRFASNAIYKGTSGNAVGTNPMYNTTSNFYVYDLSANFSEIWSSTSGTTSTTLLKYNTSQAIPHIAVFAQYPDYNVTSIGYNCFNNASNLKTIALYSRPFNSTTQAPSFQNCTNLQVIQGLNLSGVTNMYSTFYNCANLNQNIQIPNSVISMYYTFYHCYNFNQPITIPNSVTNIRSTFAGCSNLNQRIIIGNSVTNMYCTFLDCYNLGKNVTILSNQVADTRQCFYNTSLPKNVYIPFKYSNGVNSATFNSFVAAGYLTSAGASTGQNGVTVRDLNA